MHLCVISFHLALFCLTFELIRREEEDADKLRILIGEFLSFSSLLKVNYDQCKEQYLISQSGYVLLAIPRLILPCAVRLHYICKQQQHTTINILTSTFTLV